MKKVQRHITGLLGLHRRAFLKVFFIGSIAAMTPDKVSASNSGDLDDIFPENIPGMPLVEIIELNARQIKSLGCQFLVRNLSDQPVSVCALELLPGQTVALSRTPRLQDLPARSYWSSLSETSFLSY